ncbi:MAG: xanthan lyase [Porphyromonadaceae bacterium]|nr:xanthan lyase [Porphyromonadaceae bacterium]
MFNNKIKIFTLSILLFISGFSFSQTSLIKTLEDSLTVFGMNYAQVGNVKITKMTPYPAQKRLSITTNLALSYLPLRPNNVDSIYKLVSELTKFDYPDYKISIYSDDREIGELIPGYFRKSGRSPMNRFTVKTTPYPLKRNISAPYVITNGLQNRHLAVWQSHGRYYNQSRQEWRWQRPILFSTVEDLYAQAYVLPFLVPMLENAGANVLIPRERDTQLHEVIVDNDKSTHGSELKIINKSGKWSKGGFYGFAHLKEQYRDKENPFRMGSYLQTATTKNETNHSEIRYIPHIPESGKYAVYVSYKTVVNGTRDARYTIRHRGGKTDFTVNQTMGGGTWIYLGHFHFEEGANENQGVFLSNFSSDAGKMVTADAVKFGGGMGNISRKRADEVIRRTIGTGRKRRVQTSTKKYTNYSISQYPRFTEGSRYWLQWAGAPDTIYSRTDGTNDYSDDFQSRGFWVNYMAGGSSVLPGKQGLKVPIDMAFAFHTDAGIRGNDTILGTLAIFTVPNTEKKTVYENRISRWNAREMTDIIQTQIVNDIQRSYYPQWVRRGLWNRNYSESRVPEVPTMLLELLSHQNFGDMRLGHDPRFRFMVSRAIYKGMLRYLATVNDFEYVVQPLPVENFSTRFVSDTEVKLSWTPVKDSLEPTAKPDSYIVYTRIDDGGLDNGVLVKATSFTKKIEKGKIYSFKVEALNKGGKSFPSEILSVCKMPNNNPTVLIVNAFNRVSAPESFSVGKDVAGFNENYDAGVPYISDISYTGKQTEFRRYRPYVDDDNVGFGASNKEFEHKEIAGNTFDYPFVHGKAIKAAGFSFVSSSEQSVLNSTVKLHNYKIVDLILGKERQKFNPIDSTKIEFKTFEPEMRKAITQLTDSGGNLLISGSNIVSDLVFSKSSLMSERIFMEKVLKIKWTADKVNNINQVDFRVSPIREFSANMHFGFHSVPNSKSYFVEAPDIVVPADVRAFKICEYKQNESSAGIAYKEKYGVCAFGFPIETIQREEDRFQLMKNVLKFFTAHRER